MINDCPEKFALSYLNSIKSQHSTLKMHISFEKSTYNFTFPFHHAYHVGIIHEHSLFLVFFPLLPILNGTDLTLNIFFVFLNMPIVLFSQNCFSILHGEAYLFVF